MSPMIHYLGLVLDGRWEFSEHFAALVSKVSRMVDGCAYPPDAQSG